MWWRAEVPLGEASRGLSRARTVQPGLLDHRRPAVLLPAVRPCPADPPPEGTLVLYGEGRDGIDLALTASSIIQTQKGACATDPDRRCTARAGRTGATAR